jgi:hypothetical protein
MKRLKMFLIALLIAGMSLWAYGYTEGTKTLIGKDTGVVIQVPEKAPEFLTWPSMLIGAETFPNGVTMGLMESVNSDRTVGVLSLWVVKDKKYAIVAIAVYYINSHSNKPELYEDLGFLQTGKPTGILVPVKDADSLEAFKSAAQKMEI